MMSIFKDYLLLMSLYKCSSSICISLHIIRLSQLPYIILVIIYYTMAVYLSHAIYSRQERLNT